MASAATKAPGEDEDNRKVAKSLENIHETLRFQT